MLLTFMLANRAERGFGAGCSSPARDPKGFNLKAVDRIGSICRVNEISCSNWADRVALVDCTCARCTNHFYYNG